MSVTLCVSLLVLGALDNVVGRVKSIILDDYNVLGLLVDAFFYLIVLGLLLAQDKETLIRQGQFQFFLAWHTPKGKSPLVQKRVSREFTFGAKGQHISNHHESRHDELPPHENLTEPFLPSSRGSLTDATTISFLDAPSHRSPDSDTDSYTSHPEVPPLCCLEHAFWSIARAVCSVLCLEKISLASSRICEWCRLLPDIKFLPLIASLESIGFAALALVQPKIPGPLAVSTNVILLPWTALMAFVILKRRISLAQCLGLLIICLGACMVTLPSTASPMPGVLPLDRFNKLPLKEAQSTAISLLQYHRLLGYLLLRILAFLPLAAALVVRELLIIRYRLFSRTIFQREITSADGEADDGSSHRRKFRSRASHVPSISEASEHLVDQDVTASLSVPLLSFGETAARLTLAPISVSVVFLMSSTASSVGDLWTDGSNCLLGKSTPGRDCTMAPMAYATYLTVNLAFNLAAVGYLKHNSAIKAVNMAQLIPPLTALIYHFIPFPLLTAADRAISWEVWAGIATIVLGQYVYDSYSPSGAPSDERQEGGSVRQMMPPSSTYSSGPRFCEALSDSQAMYATLIKNGPNNSQQASPSSTRHSPFYPQGTSDWGLESAMSDEPIGET